MSLQYVWNTVLKLKTGTREKENNSKLVALTLSVKEDALLILASLPKQRETSKVRPLKLLPYTFVKQFFYFLLHARIMCVPFITGVQNGKHSTTSCKWNPEWPSKLEVVVSLIKGLQSHFYIVTLLHTWDGKYSLAAKDRWSRRMLWYLLTYLWCSQH